MNKMSRRSILHASAGAATAIAFSPISRISAQTPPDERIIESSLTGSTIELVSDEWSFSLGFGGQDKGDDFLRELYIMENASSQLEVEFVQTELTPEQYLEARLDDFLLWYPEMEIAGSGAEADGIWFAASLADEGSALSVYCEYQAGAYEEADLVLTLKSAPDDFQANLPSAQAGVLVGDLAPFMMIEPSNVMALEFPVVAVAVATETTGRTTRSSRRAGGTDEPEPTETSRRSNRRGQNQQDEPTAAADGDFVEVVRTHRDDFLGTLDAFNTALGVFIADDSTEEEQAEAFEAIAPLAEEWTTYPQRAGQTSAPAEFAELGALYSDWADEISSLGTLWFDFLGRTATVEDFFAQLEVVDQIDLDLGDLLDTL